MGLTFSEITEIVMLFQYSENFILLACVAAGPRTRQNHLNYTHVAIQFQAFRRKSRLKAAKKKFAQSKCRILHALHKLRKKRARKTSVVQMQTDSKVTFHTITSSISLVTTNKLCLAFQHLIQIGRLITNWVRN